MKTERTFYYVDAFEGKQRVCKGTTENRKAADNVYEALCKNGYDALFLEIKSNYCETKKVY